MSCGKARTTALLKVYAKCIDGQDETARRRIEAALALPDNLAV